MATLTDALLVFDPEDFTTGIAYARALVDADPSINLDRYARICHWHGANKRRGFSKDRFHAAVREWRIENGLPLRPHGVSGKARAANWLPDEAVEAAEPPENGLGTDTTPPDEEATSTSIREDGAAALAELVWEWMEAHNLEMATFWDDGEVSVTKSKPKKREFSLVVDKGEA
jgi:hypothetical protein